LANVGLSIFIVIFALAITLETWLVDALFNAAILEAEGAGAAGLRVLPCTIEGVGKGPVDALPVELVVPELSDIGVTVNVFDLIALAAEPGSALLF
jgi:hypothetical protein